MPACQSSTEFIGSTAPVQADILISLNSDPESDRYNTSVVSYKAKSELHGSDPFQFGATFLPILVSPLN